MTCIMFALCQSVRCQDFYLSARILVHLQFQSLLSVLFTHGTLPWALAPPTILLRFLRSMIRLFIPCVLHCIRASVPWARAPLPLSDCRGGKRGAPGVAGSDEPDASPAQWGRAAVPKLLGRRRRPPRRTGKERASRGLWTGLCSPDLREEHACTNWPQTPRAPGNQLASVFRISARALSRICLFINRLKFD